VHLGYFWDKFLDDKGKRGILQKLTNAGESRVARHQVKRVFLQNDKSLFYDDIVRIKFFEEKGSRNEFFERAFR
jgi:hypothetical protein